MTDISKAEVYADIWAMLAKSYARNQRRAAQADRNPKGHDPAEGHGRNDESPVAATSGDAPEGS